MKQLLLPLCLVLHLAAAAQNPAATLTYDFSKGAFVASDLTDRGTVKPLPYNSFAVIRIINVNTFRYNVQIQGRSIDYVTQVPSELQAIFRLPDQAQSRQSTQAGVEAINTLAKQAEETKRTNQNLNTFQARINTKRMKLMSLQTDIGDLTKQKRASKDQDFKANIDLQLDDLITERAALNQEIDNQSAYQNAWDRLVTASKNFSTVTGQVADIKFHRISLINLVKQNWPDYNTMMQNAPAGELTEAQMQRTFKDFGTRYAEVQALANEAKGLGDADQKKQVDDLMKLAKDGYDAITENGLLNLIQDILILQQALSSGSSFMVVSPPIQVEGDFTSFTIRATPVRVSDLMNFTPDRNFPVELPTRGGLMVDFSVGPTVSFGASARDRKYYLEPTASEDTAILRQRGNHNAVTPGLAALMHFYGRSGRNIAWGGLFGVGAGFQATDQANFNLYGGLSLVLGKRQKIMLNTGISYLRVDRLRTGEYEEGKKYNVAQFRMDQATEKVFKPSFFVGISYNITNRVEIN